MRPIGIGDVPRRKAILYVIGDDIALAAGPLQTYAGHSAGLEAVIHAMKDMFDDSDCEAALLVDATNAFNCVNHQAALHDIFMYFLLFLKKKQLIPGQSGCL